MLACLCLTVQTFEALLLRRTTYLRHLHPAQTRIGYGTLMLVLMAATPETISSMRVFFIRRQSALEQRAN
ncbi:hypothetical protein ABIB90_007658 [Bradyrhizobium sp. JR4.1]